MITRYFASAAAGVALAVFLLLLSACSAIDGEALFAENCSSCHSFKGKGGNTAPDLTAATALFSDDWMGQQIRDPKKNNPRSRMPAYPRLSVGEIRALIAYLKS